MSLDRFSYSIFRFASENGLIAAEDKIIISLSGGIDSMCLFRLFHAWREKIPLGLHLVHFNHGLRKESANEEIFLRDLAGKMNFPISVITASHFKGQKGVQNKARKWRYYHLTEIMNKIRFGKIALGHHLDDLMETQIWKMLRGGSLYSLNPMQEKVMPFIRPLLRTRKEELRNYLLDIKQSWCEDQSNYSGDYTRNMIRHELVPLMKKCAGGTKLEEKFLALNDDARHLKQCFEGLVSVQWIQNDILAYQTIKSLAPVFAYELIHRFLLFNGQVEINRRNIQRIYELVVSNRGNWTIDLKKNYILLGKNKMISVVRTGEARLDQETIERKE